MLCGGRQTPFAPDDLPHLVLSQKPNTTDPMTISNTTPLSEIRFSLKEVRDLVLDQEIDWRDTPVIGISSNHHEDENTLTALI